MALTVPNPTVPTNGQALDATPLLANLNAIYQAIQSFDASQIAAGTLIASAFNASINPNTLLNETTFPFVASGLVWSQISGLNGGMTSGVLYYNGIRVSVTSIATHAFTASKDTYIDIDVNGNVAYSAVSNNAASPSLTANSIRVAIVVTDAGAITSVNKGDPVATVPVASSINYSVTDSLGNLIYPTDPQRRLLGYRQITSSVLLSASTSDADVTGLSVPVIVPSGRKVKISLYFPDFSQSGGIGTVYTAAKILESTTVLQAWGMTPGTANFPMGIFESFIVSPSAGLHTYKAGYANNATGPIITFDAFATSPAFIMVELL